MTGNHRDAWVYGAVDPSSGTAAMLEAVHGVGALLNQGWRPKRTIVFCSWDAEEEGLIGSTEWVEQHAKTLERAVAYFNVDVAVSGPDFSASAVPSLKQFVREVTRSVPSPLGGTVYQQWSSATAGRRRASRLQCSARPAKRPTWAISAPAPTSRPSCSMSACPPPTSAPKAPTASTTPPSTTSPGTPRTPTRTSSISRRWPASSAWRPCAWPMPTCCPYDYVTYAREISAYYRRGQAARPATRGSTRSTLPLPQAAASRLAAAAAKAQTMQIAPSGDLARLNLALRQTETAFISDAGLPNRPWYRHTIFAPGEFTGYSAV